MWPGNRVGLVNNVGSGNKVGPENQVGALNNSIFQLNLGSSTSNHVTCFLNATNRVKLHKDQGIGNDNS